MSEAKRQLEESRTAWGYGVTKEAAMARLRFI